MKNIEKATYVSIDTIKPYENNPRTNDAGIDALAESILQFGWQQPIVVDKNSVIIVGHTRYKAAKKLGYKEVPVSVADWLTEEQARAYRIADNKTASLSTWDYDKLVDEIQKASETDFSKLGFSEVELLGLSGNFTPDGFGDEEGYEDIGEAQLKAHRITIYFHEEDEERLKALLREEGDLKVVYRTSELMAREAFADDEDTPN